MTAFVQQTDLEMSLNGQKREKGRLALRQVGEFLEQKILFSKALLRL